MRLFFATDIHGSETCFRKLLNAARFYNVDATILGGDITGKSVVEIVRQEGGTHRAVIGGEVHSFDSQRSLQAFCEHVENVGQYPYVTDEEDLSDLRRNGKRAEALFKDLILRRLELWLELIEQKYASSDSLLYVCTGNDDEFFVDDVLSASKRIVLLDDRIVPLDDGTDILSISYSNPTPWHTPRECSEDQMATKIQSLVDRAVDPSRAVFNFHVPPKNTSLDRCARLDEDLKVVTHLGLPELTPVGSTAVRRAVETQQPVLGLFGHVHEGRGYTHLGRTLCINPGSNYSEGVLNGCVVTLERGRVIDYQLTAG